MPDSLVAGLEHASTGFTVAFSLELVLKVSGLGLREWSKDPANVFDALVVSVDLLSLLFSAALGSGSANFSVLRTLRMVRLLYAIPRPSLHKLLSTMKRAISASSSLCALLLLFLFMFTLLLMSVFGGSFEFCLTCTPLPDTFALPLSHGGYAHEEDVAPWGVGGEGVNERLCRCDGALGVCLEEPDLTQCVKYIPRANFDAFGVALVSTFQIFTGENWQFIMYDGARSNGLGSVVLYVILFLIGRYVLLNMYATRPTPRGERLGLRRSLARHRSPSP